MTDSDKTLVVSVSPDTSIDQTVRRMALESRQVEYAGLAIVSDEADGKVLGVVTDGDIRRAYARDIDWHGPVGEIMSSRPIAIGSDIPRDRVLDECRRKVSEADHLTADNVRHILVVDEAGALVDIHDYISLLHDSEYRTGSVAILGMGFVGLTVGAALANLGHRVTGVDTNEAVVSRLRAASPHVYEPGLEEMIRHCLGRKTIEFRSNLDVDGYNTYIIAVGTPLRSDGQPDYGALTAAAASVGRTLRGGEQVHLRSTVPVGATREILVKVLETESGLKAGEQFSVAFAPERTVAGAALTELRSLPQLLGGLTKQCGARAANFWNSLTPSVVRVDSLEAAEMAKLANNSFRDLCFAFSNELVLLCDRFNLDASDVVGAANNGYIRNPIPRPSPGVGGYCLTKDPLLLAQSHVPDEARPRLGREGRSANERAAAYPAGLLAEFAAVNGRNLGSMSVLVVGLAFKGEPETNDLRGSTGLELAETLKDAGCRVLGWDAVIKEAEIVAAGLEAATDLNSAAREVDAIMIMNNHRDNALLEMEALGENPGGRLVFDGWNLLDRLEVESVPGLFYASLGYFSVRSAA